MLNPSVEGLSGFARREAYPGPGKTWSVEFGLLGNDAKATSSRQKSSPDMWWSFPGTRRRVLCCGESWSDVPIAQDGHFTLATTEDKTQHWRECSTDIRGRKEGGEGNQTGPRVQAKVEKTKHGVRVLVARIHPSEENPVIFPVQSTGCRLQRVPDFTLNIKNRF